MNVNKLTNETLNTIVKIISTDILIKKKLNDNSPNLNANKNDELKLMKVLVSDSTGSINAIIKDDLIKFMKIGQEVIMRNAKIEVINGHLMLICDENAVIFESNNLISNSDCANKLNNNFSSIKLNKLEDNIR